MLHLYLQNHMIFIKISRFLNAVVSNNRPDPLIYRSVNIYSVGLYSNLVLTPHASRLSAESWMTLDRKKEKRKWM